MLQQYYRMVGANPTPVAWGETPSAIKQGVADALDPSVGALYVFGFKDILSHVTFTQAVPDSQVYSMNLEWFNSCRPTCRKASSSPVRSPRSRTLPRCPAARNYAMAELAKSGVEFHTLSDDQLAEWKEAGGYQRSEWDGFKVDLAGSMDTFAQLEEAAGTHGPLLRPRRLIASKARPAPARAPAPAPTAHRLKITGRTGMCRNREGEGPC
jgi:TRAP-type C4-dicarboxylate transport system substrate-binding protein